MGLLNEPVPTRAFRWPGVLALLPLAGCSAAPNPVPTPSATPAPVELHAVAVIVFYDENANGRLDRDEDVRVPNATVTIAGRTGVSDKDRGRAVLPSVPAGPQEVWIRNFDRLIRELAVAQGAVLVDLEAAFRREGDLSALFADHVHPNDRGYRIMANEFFRAITQPDASQALSFGFESAWDW